jgi:hypothetical protein
VASGPDSVEALREAGADIVLDGLDRAEALLGAL